MLIETNNLFNRLSLAYKPRFKILQGGSSSGKTFSILQYLIVLALQSKASKICSIVAENNPALKRGALRDFIKILGDSYSKEKHNKTEGTYKLGKWTFEFFGADIDSKLRGARRDILFVNECNNVHYNAYTQLEMRTRDLVFLDYNPAQEFWVHTQVIPSLNSEEFFFDISTYHDNKFVPPESVKSIERRKYNAAGEISEWYKVYGLGQVGSLEGTIYTDWVQIDEFPSDLPYVFGLDFGFTNDPTALVKVALKDDDIYIQELMYKKQLTNSKIAKQFILHNVDRKDFVFCDSSEPKSIAELRQHGYTTRGALKGPDSVRKGIDWIQSKKLHVVKTSQNIIKELRNYTWVENKDGEYTNVPVDDYNHGLDALRYALSPHIQIRTAKPVSF